MLQITGKIIQIITTDTLSETTGDLEAASYRLYTYSVRDALSQEVRQIKSTTGGRVLGETVSLKARWFDGRDIGFRYEPVLIETYTAEDIRRRHEAANPIPN